MMEQLTKGKVEREEAQELPDSEKLRLAERANEIYRQQIKYMQDQLGNMRSLVSDKEQIIENLMLRFDLGLLSPDASKSSAITGSSEIDKEELMRKAEALAQRTILENFELREMVNELRDENFHLRNEIYELQDRVNRQALVMNKHLKVADSLESMLRNELEKPSTGKEKVTKMDGSSVAKDTDAQRMGLISELNGISETLKKWRDLDEDGYRKGSDPDTKAEEPRLAVRQDSADLFDRMLDDDSDDDAMSGLFG